VSWLVGDRVLRLGVGIFVGVWVARYLGPEQYGLLSYSVAFASLFSALASLGLDGIVVRDITDNPHRRGATLGTALLVKLLGGALTLSLSLGAILLIRPKDPVLHWMVGLIAAGAVFQSVDAIDLWFQSQVSSRFTVFAKNSAFVAVSIGKIPLLCLQAPLLAFAGANLAEVILGSAGLLIAYYACGQSFRTWRFERALARELLQASWPLILSSIAIIIYMRIDQVMLGEMVGDRAVGIYSAATRISELWYFIPTAIVSSIFPSIIESKKSGEGAYYGQIQTMFDLVTALALFIIIPVSLFSGTLVRLLYTDAYASAGPILAVHIWSALFVFVGVAQSSWHVAEGLTKLSLWKTLGGAVINVVLNLLLLPRYAGLGAAIATLIAYAFAAFASNAIHPRTRPIFFLQVRSLLSLGLFHRHA
jgi:polysaccharide transporter, PST family